MGFKISWLAFEGLKKQAVLDLLAFRDTGTADEANEAPFSAAELATGWTIVWSNDTAWVETRPIHDLGVHGRTIACQVHEGIMYSAAHGAEAGVEQWSVVHDAQDGLRHLEVAGVIPEAFGAIKAKAFADQDSDKSGEVDHIFDIPVELAFAITGFRYDLWDLPSGPRPHWTIVEAKKF